MMGPPLPPGVWFESTRNRYRTRLYIGTKMFHRSYHPNAAAAIAARDRALAQRAQRPLYVARLLSPADQISALLREIPSVSGDNPLMSKLLTVDRFRETYYDVASAPSKYTVWRWIRKGLLAARRVGRSYYIATDDAERFTQTEPPA
jgi:hypothetical protein